MTPILLSRERFSPYGLQTPSHQKLQRSFALLASPPCAKRPTKPAGVPGGCGGPERRILACYNAGCADHRVRATLIANYKHTCASS